MGVCVTLVYCGVCDSYEDSYFVLNGIRIRPRKGRPRQREGVGLRKFWLAYSFKFKSAC